MSAFSLLAVAATALAAQLPGPTPAPDDPYEPDANIRPTLSMKVAPKAAPYRPYRFTLLGDLQTNGVDESTACNGRVTLRIRKSNPTVAKGRTQIQPDCTFSKTLTLRLRHAGKKAKRGGNLRITARFGGNDYLQPDSAPQRKALYGRAAR